jgi:hypothetical protein
MLEDPADYGKRKDLRQLDEQLLSRMGSILVPGLCQCIHRSLPGVERGMRREGGLAPGFSRFRS